MSGLTIDDFAGWVSGSCEVTADDGPVAMTLIGAEPIPGSPREGGGFRLEFRGPAEPILQQAIRGVAGPTSRYEIFMVPIARDGEGTRYEAVFY